MNFHNRILYMAIIYLISVRLFAGEMDNPEIIRLSEPDDIQDAWTINGALDELSNKIMQRVEKKLHL